MAELPNSLAEAITQARTATQQAIAAGYTRLQVELVFPEIQLQAQSITEQFIPDFEQFGSHLKVLFCDAGAAALARRDWGQVEFGISDLGTSRSPIEHKISPEDQVYLIVSPSSVEIQQVEKLCNLAGDRPVVLLNPCLEDAAIVGIGYAGRQLRERFLNSLYSCYYIRPLADAILFRCFPSAWLVWLETENSYELIAEESEKPLGDALEQILIKATNGSNSSSSPQIKRQGFFGEVRRFFQALSR